MEAVGIGDLHFDKLDKVLPIKVSSWIGVAIRRVLDYALENGITQVIFYGDICDKPRLSYEAQTVLYKVMLNPRYRKLHFHFVLGNHDFAEDGTHSLEVLEIIAKFTHLNLEVYTKPTGVKLDGIPFMMLPHPYKETSKHHVNVGHFEQAGAVGDSGRAFGEEFFATKDFTLIGHLHTKQHLRASYWSGTLYQCNFGESLPKFFHHISINSLKDYRVRCIPFDPPWKLINATVNNHDDLAGISDEKRTYYKLFIQEGADVDLNQVLVDHPQIIKTNLFKTKAELKMMIEAEWSIDTDSIDTSSMFDEGKMLADFLAAEGLTRKQVQRGLAKMDELRSK